MARTKAQLQAYVRLQAACSSVAYAQREFQLASARLIYASRLVSDETQDISKQDLMYFTRRRDLTQDRYMAARERLHAILVVIAVLYEADRRVQTKCLELIYYPYPETSPSFDGEGGIDWLEIVGDQVSREISHGIMSCVDELNQLVHASGKQNE